jgi:hypothetical protein
MIRIPEIVKQMRPALKIGSRPAAQVGVPLAQVYSLRFLKKRFSWPFGGWCGAKI